METRPSGTDPDKELFVTILGRLLRPLADEVVNGVIEHEAQITAEARRLNPDAPAEELPMQDFVGEVHTRILGKLYDLAQNETMLSMALIPLMAHLKKMPKAMITDFDYEEKRRKGQL